MLAGLIATRPGRTPRLIYSSRLRRGRAGESFSEADYAALLVPRTPIGGPIVLLWDNLNTHRSARMSALVAARPWLTVFPLPAWAQRGGGGGRT